MIRRFIVGLFFILLLFSIALALLGVKHVDMGEPFINFIKRCNFDMRNYAFHINPIESIEDVTSAGVFNDFVNFFIHNANIFIFIINFFIYLINWAIQLVQFCYAVISNAIIMRNELLTQSSSSSELLSSDSVSLVLLFG